MEFFASHFRRGLMLGSAAATVAVCCAGTALAQDMPESTEPRYSTNEIIVTARRREESLQDVPVVVTAIDAATIERNAIDGFDALSRSTPGLLIYAVGSASVQGGISLRGIQTGSLNLASDQAVSVNIDGVQIDNALAVKAGMFDLQQIEILKGPQALFFGKNSSGGVMAIRSADPTDELFLQARAGYEFSANERYGSLIASSPLSDTFGARAAIQYSNMDGWFANVSSAPTSERVPNASELIARGTLKWDPSDRFNARLKLTYADRKSDNYFYGQKSTCFRPEATSVECRLDHNIAVSVPIDVLDRFDYDETFADSRFYLASMEMNYELTGDLTLSSITGYYNFSQSTFDSVNARGPDDFFVLPSNPNEILFQSFDDIWGLSQEIRLTSGFDGPLDFMLGAFIDDRSVQSDAMLQFGGTGVARNLQGVDSNAFSMFGQLSFDILENLELSGGARYTKERREYHGTLLEAVGPFPVGTPLVPTDDVLKDDNISPEVTLTWRPTNDVTLFAAYKQGYKSGSFDMSAISNLALLGGPRELRFGSESADGFEVGFKTMWFDNQLRLNGAIYRYDYEGLQVNAFDSNTFATRVLNVGKARTEGVELDMQYAPSAVEGLIFNAAVNYNNGRYIEFISDCNQQQETEGTCPLDLRPPVGNESQDFAGKQLKTAPEWTATWGVSLARPLYRTMGFRAGLNFNYSSSYETEERGHPLGIQDSYLTINGNMGISTGDGRWSLDLIGVNLTDELYLTTSNSQPFTGGSGVQRDYFVNVDRGRQVRLQLTARY